MTPEVLYFIPGLLEDTVEHIEVADGHHVTTGRKGQVRIKMCDHNRDNFIATLARIPPKSLLGSLSLSDMRAIDAYIFWLLLCFPL